MALSDSLGNMGYQYLRSQNLTNSAADLAMMGENKKTHGTQAKGFLQQIELLEQQAQEMIYDSMEQGQIPAYFLNKHIGDPEAAREEHAIWISDMENRRRVRQQNWLTAEDIYKIGGEAMLDEWVNWSDAAPSFLGKGKWADMASMPLRDGPEGLSFQPQVRTTDGENIWTADMTVDGEPEGTSPSVGFLPFSELDTFMDRYKSALSTPAGANPIYGSIPIFDRDTSRLDTMAAYQAATGQQNALQAAADAAKAKVEGMEQTLIDEPTRLKAEEIAAAEAEAEATMLERKAAAVSGEETARTAERGYSLDLVPGEGAFVNEDKTFPVGKELSGMLPTFSRKTKLQPVIDLRGVFPLRQKKRKMGDDWKGLKAPDIANYPEGYIQIPGTTPFDQNPTQWDSLGDYRRAELTAIAEIGTEATLEEGRRSAIGNGKVFVAGAAGGAKQYKNSLLYQQQLGAEKGTTVASEQFKDVRGFYQSED